MRDSALLSPFAIDVATPTLINQLLNCELRLSFERDLGTSKPPGKLPSQVIGIAKHYLIETAYKFTSNSSEPNKKHFENLWDSFILAQQVEMKSEWFPSTVPEPESWPNYFLERSKTIRRCVKISTRPKQSSDGLIDGTGIESWIKDPTSILSGRPDRISINADGVRIIDLKPGDVSREITTDQIRQLQIYGFIYFQRFGVIPNALTIERIDGSQEDVSFTFEEIKTLALHALTAVKAFNSEVVVKTRKSVATPGAENCKWCPYKLECSEYWSNLESSWGHSSIYGEVLSFGESDQGNYVDLRVISPIDQFAELKRVIGLPVAFDSGGLKIVDLQIAPDNETLRTRWSSRYLVE